MAQRLRGIPVGRIGGVPIFLAPSWVLSIAVIAVLGVPVVSQVVPGTAGGTAVAVAVLLAVLLGASVLAHELGHCLAARRMGLTVVGVRLYLLGGVSELARVPRSPREEAIVAAAGPGVSAVLAGLFWLAAQAALPGTIGWLLLMLLALSNLLVTVFNLLPALPLDGGRVLRAGVWRASGNRRAGTTAAVIGGYLVAVGLAAWGAALLFDGGTAALLPASLAVLMALFVVIGAAAEKAPSDGSVRHPTAVSFTSLIRPLTNLPSATPVRVALQAAAQREVILTGSDGVARGLLDVRAARLLADRDPEAPASLVAHPLSPYAIVLADDDPAEVTDRIRAGADSAFVLVDAAGRPAGVLRKQDLPAEPGASRPRGWRRLRRGSTEAPPAHTTGPHWENLHRRNPHGENPHTGLPHGENPYGENPYGENPYGEQQA